MSNIVQWTLGVVLVCSSLGIVLARNPVHASLSFLLTLLTLATYYLQLSAQFIAVMQVLVYAGAILVIFMFVIVLFQDAHYQLDQYKPKSSSILLLAAASAFLLTLAVLGRNFASVSPSQHRLPDDFGSVQSIGKLLYVDFFFPFEAIVLLFLVAVVGALYIARKGT